MDSNTILYITGYTLIFLLGVLITRAIFNIPTITRHLKAHTKLLSEIAQKNGVDKDVVDQINKEVNTVEGSLK